ncbi:radical SAM/SPASM domain-containing protein [Nitrososphaera viennensis]|uniref:Radical SAM protein n=2 Tax=Nitrososphaera viennensis TaxID=1034015 RepID=A0A977IGP4_9ARCH|nr:radical SAM protein [Nitrososphaera viennensis]AIC15532.1 putative radical SAM domain protein [Nitrososphaera viennensis EN76]UVS70417.1 radical SAM protein [Nitrososphaera viennensis]
MKTKLKMIEEKEQYLSKVPKYPYHMVWHVTNLCNVHCQHCSSNAKSRLPDELSPEEGIKLLDDLADAGVLDLSLSGGEALLRDDIYDIIRYARRKNMNVGLGSSGSTVTEQSVKEMKKAGITRVQISVDGLPYTHDVFRGLDGIFGRAMDAIEMLVENKITTKVCFTANKLNYRQMDEVVDRVAAMGVSTFNLSQYIPVGRGPKELDLSTEEWKYVYERWVAKKNQYTKMMFTSHTDKLVLVDECYMEMPGFIGCQAGIGLGSIRANGDIIPCVFLPLKVGNIRDGSFKEIWDNSDVIKHLKDRDVEGHCGSCDFKYKCGGCRAAAYAYTGNYLAADDRCWGAK